MKYTDGQYWFRISLFLYFYIIAYTQKETGYLQGTQRSLLGGYF